jgi:FKBP-type peptidyl-prolyl cis-trans isomerase FkpA
MAACANQADMGTEESGAGMGTDFSSVGLTTEDERVLYTLGQYLGQNVVDAGLSEEELAPVMAGLSDSALRRPSRVDLDQYGSILPIFMQQRIMATSQTDLANASEFMEEQAALPGATRTDSGIVIQEITAGTGAQPAADDTVTVHYHGTLPNGQVFDSSVQRGEPATFPLDQVIPCWSEAVQTLKVGGKSRLVCPPDLAYGPGGAPGIPGNSPLVFEVELLEIVAD